MGPDKWKRRDFSAGKNRIGFLVHGTSKRMAGFKDFNDDHLVRHPSEKNFPLKILAGIKSHKQGSL